MEYRNVQNAVFEAYRLRDQTLCFALLDSFIADAAGDELARALSLKSALIAATDSKRSVEGLLLVDEALHKSTPPPGQAAKILTNALALCYSLGDVERGRTYENLAHRLLQQFGTHPEVVGLKFRLYLNLGLMAQLRYEYAVAYWHFVQAIRSRVGWVTEDSTEVNAWLFWLHMHTCSVCVHMGRLPEAEEAMRKAEECMERPEHVLRWQVGRAELLRHLGRSREAAEVLHKLEPDMSPTWTPDTTARFYLQHALVAQDLGDLRGFHMYLARARKKALDHSLDYLLSHIQRAQRMRISVVGAE